MIDREEAHRVLDRLIDAAERELGANDDDARKCDHKEILALRSALEAANGTLGLRRRRILSTVAGLPPHRPVATAKGIDWIFRRSDKPKHSTEQRYAIFRILQDELDALLGGGPENRESATLILADMGYHGPQPKSDKASGIRAPTVRQGVNVNDGASAAGRLSLYNALGYTLGAEGKRDCPPSVWRHRAALHIRVVGPPRRSGPKPSKQPTFNVGLAEAERIVAAAWADIEDGMKDRDLNADGDARGDLSPRATFRATWREGDADRRGNCINKSLMLQTK
jgi:hypothetical protein